MRKHLWLLFGSLSLLFLQCACSPQAPTQDLINLEPNRTIRLAYHLNQASKIELPREFIVNRNQFHSQISLSEFKITAASLKVKQTAEDTWNITSFGGSKDVVVVIPFQAGAAKTYSAMTRVMRTGSRQGRIETYLLSGKSIEKPLILEFSTLRSWLESKSVTPIQSFDTQEDCSVGKTKLKCAVSRINYLASHGMNFWHPVRVMMQASPNDQIFIAMRFQVDQYGYDFGPIEVMESNGRSTLAISEKLPNLADRYVAKHELGYFESSVGIKLPTDAKVKFNIRVPSGGDTTLTYRIGYMSNSTAELTAESTGNSNPARFQSEVECGGRVAVIEKLNISERSMKLLTGYVGGVLNFKIPSQCEGKVASLTLSALAEQDTKKSLLFVSSPEMTNNTGKIKRPNILFITADALRNDHTSLGGYSRDTTPFLKSLASQGVYFNHYFVQRSLTATSFPVIFSGKYPYRESSAFPGGAENDLNREVVSSNLASTLADHSYQTLAAVGAETWSIHPPALAHFDHLTFSAVYNDKMLFSFAQKWLQQRNKERPYFLWIHLYKPHLPYTPAAEFQKWKNDSNDPKEYFGNKYKDGNEKKKLLDPEFSKKIVALYDANIHQMDAELNSFFLQLEKDQALEDTVIAISSDHGENMTEAGHFFQHGTLQNASLHVPLVLVYPGQVPKNKTLDGIAESVDFYPTLLDLANIPIPQGLDGRSLFPNILGKNTRERLLTYSDLNAKIFSIQNKEWKYVFNPSRYSYEGINFFEPYTHLENELYQIKKDPNEKQNVFAQNEEIGLQLRQKLNHFYKNHFSREAANRPLSPEVIRLLEKVGYLHWKKD